MNKILTPLIGLALLASACSPKMSTTLTKQYPPLNTEEEVLVLGVQDATPQGAELLGVLKFGHNNPSRDCDLYTSFARMMSEAREVGGNVLKLTHHIHTGNGCQRITANILKIENPRDYLIPATMSRHNADHALLHVYRPAGAGALVNYDLNLDSTIIARSRNNWKEIITLEQEGPHTLWARTEKTASLPLDIRPGNEYYVKSSVTMGALVGRPQLELVDNKFGRVEFQAVTAATTYSTAGDTTHKSAGSGNFPRFRFLLNGGWAWRAANLPDDLIPEERAYLKKLMSGFQYDLGASYYFSEWIGMGLMFSQFRTSNTYRGILSDKIQQNFVGLTADLRLFDREKKNCLVVNFGLGYLGYRDKYTEYSEVAIISGNTVGSYMGIGYDIWLSKTSSLGFQLTLSGGSLSEYTVDYGSYKGTVKLDPEEYESLSLVCLSVGIRF